MQLMRATTMPARDVTIDARAWASDPSSFDRQLEGAADTAASQLLRRNGRDLMSLQGIASVSSLAAAPDQLTLRFATEGFAKLADNILRDAIDGVRLVLNFDVATAPGQDDWWSGSYNQMFASVRAMPGVLDSSSYVEHGLKEVGFRTTDAAASARLRAIVNPDLDGWRVSWSPFPAS